MQSTPDSKSQGSEFESQCGPSLAVQCLPDIPSRQILDAQQGQLRYSLHRNGGGGGEATTLRDMKEYVGIPGHFEESSVPVDSYLSCHIAPSNTTLSQKLTTKKLVRPTQIYAL
ncbi:hypothetical protein WISP_28231 [Willisornis vidua]|uniref:Uncharacterized protein n=1 Tax=Willisornis vidua TaxID=1566151 RepID=A0ABQ9DL11_9PASS|nr:hypothetical protein WISP_28231 [Willisornis vidua]